MTGVKRWHRDANHPGMIEHQDGAYMLVTDVEKLLASSQHTRRVRHKARDKTYQVLGEAEAQVSKGTLSAHGRMLTEGQHLTVYRADDEKLWVCFPDEFEDGRFESID